MNLILDLGNTQSKVALFKNNELIEKRSYKGEIAVEEIQVFIEKLEIPSAVIISSVIDHNPELILYLKNFGKLIVLDHTTELPIVNEYSTPKTLGKDRLANAVGASFLFKGKDCLVIDAGTCIKYDFISSKNKYVGGLITPGAEMRLKAMHTFTDKLPLLEKDLPNNPIGTSTKEAMIGGVYFGILEEINGMISRIEKDQNCHLTTILTGGDLEYFAKGLKKSIFANQVLTLQGLNTILEHNA